MVLKKIGTAAAIFDDAGRILLVKHNYGPLNWELPGGGAEADESIEQTAVRETLEETGLNVVPIRLSGIYYELERDVTGFVYICKRIDDLTPVPQASEISECGYWALDSLPRPISDFTLRRIEDAKSGVILALPVQVPPKTILE